MSAQTFVAAVSQVFPAEDDVDKHVEDNCEFSSLASGSGWNVVTTARVCVCRFPDVPQRSHAAQQRARQIQQRQNLRELLLPLILCGGTQIGNAAQDVAPGDKCRRSKRFFVALRRSWPTS